MELFDDLRFGLRGLARRPFHTAAALFVLALGLAASSTAFSFVNTFYQRIPGSDAGDRLVSILFVGEKGGISNYVPYQDFLEYAAEDEVLDELAGFVILTAGTLRRSADEAATWVWGRAATTGFFSMLDVEMSVGRSFSAGSDRPGSPPECVLSHHFWREHFGGDPSVVGDTVLIQRQEFLVTGVASEEYRTIFEGFHPDLWMSVGGLAALEPEYARKLADRSRASIGIMGRLAPGVTYEQAAERLGTLAESLRSEHRPEEAPRRVEVLPKLRIVDYHRKDMQPLLLAMIIAAGGLLVLAVANVANVFLSVALGRRRELAVRAALGAGPGRLVRLILVENLLVSLAAGGLGLVLTVPTAQWLMWSQFVGTTSLLTFPAAPVVTLDLPFYGFLLVVALLAGTVSGLVPALGAARREMVPALKEQGDTSPGRRTSARDVMVTVQVALALLLTVAAGLMVRSFGQASSVRPNFDSDGLLVATFSLAAKEMTPAERRVYLRHLEERLEREPGVASAVVTRRVPFGMGFSGLLRIEGREPGEAGGDKPAHVEFGAARPGFFETLGLPLVAGRHLDERDDAEAPGAVVVNQAMARHFFDGEEAVGRRVFLVPSGEDEERAFEIVGVVSDVRFGEGNLNWWKDPTVYFSLDQHGHSPKSGGFSPGFGLLVRTEADGLDKAWLHRTLRGHDGALAVMNVVTMPDLVSGQLFEQRANAQYFAALAALGLVLAALGLWSVLDVAVRRRFREIGIRMALGASRADVAAAVLRRSFVAVGAGLVLGLAAGLAATRLLESLLYGVRATDPWSFLAGAAVLCAVAFAATALPARRATRLDPLRCLREE